MILPKKYFIIIVDNYIPHFRANLRGSLSDEDSEKFRRVLIKNLMDTLPPVRTTNEVLILTNHPMNPSDDIPAGEIIRNFQSFNSLTDSRPEIMNEGNLIIFVSLCILGLTAVDIENIINILDREEENGIFVLDSDSRVALFASNTWNDGITVMKLGDHSEYSTFLKNALSLPFKIDRLVTRNTIHSACNAGKIYELMSDRKNSLFKDPANHKELNLLFIEHKEILPV